MNRSVADCTDDVITFYDDLLCFLFFCCVCVCVCVCVRVFFCLKILFKFNKNFCFAKKLKSDTHIKTTHDAKQKNARNTNKKTHAQNIFITAL